MDRKLGIILECIPASEERMKMIKDTGFDTVFTGQVERSAVLAIREEAERLGLTVETIHAPFAGINEM